MRELKTGQEELESKPLPVKCGLNPSPTFIGLKR